MHVHEALHLLDIDVSMGLSMEEAERRRRLHGPNRINRRGRRSAWRSFFGQLNQPLVYVLLLAGSGAAFLGEKADCAVILGVALVNAIIGHFQETKAGKALEALTRLVVTESVLRRDGCRRTVLPEDLVPGDVVLLRAGDKVPADLRP